MATAPSSYLLNLTMFKKLIKKTLSILALELDHLRQETEIYNMMNSFRKCGKDVELCYPFDIRLPENIVIGDRVFIGPKITIGAWPEGNVIIEDDVLIGPDVSIFGGDHEYSKMDKEIKNSGYGRVEPVIIKKGAWIGAKAIILRGVTVGKGAVIAAGSVVVKEIPEYEIWGGNPAKFLKKRSKHEK